MNIKLLLGILPNTNKYEEVRNALFEEFLKHQEYAKSDELKNYIGLQEEINSQEFKNKVEAIKAQKYSDTPEYKKEKEYIELKNSQDIKSFYKFKNSGENDWIISYENSPVFKEILELNDFVSTDEFVKVKQEMSRPGKERFKETDSYLKLQAFTELNNDRQLKNYYKFKKNKGLNIFLQLNGSKEWKAFLELEELVNSEKFKAEHNAVKKEEYKQTEAYLKNEEYKKLKNNQDFKLFRKVVKLSEADDYLAIDGSEKLKGYEELKELVESSAFKQERLKIEKSTFRDTQEYEKELKLKNLKKSPDYKRLTKVKNSLAYKNYTGLEGSEKIKNFEELEKYTSTEEFAKVRNYMLLKPAEKYKQSEEYQKEQAYSELNNSENIKWFYKAQKADKFKSVKNLDLTFEDDFTDKKLNKKWITRYFWGDALLKDSFSLAADKHFVTDGKNIEIKDSVLSIVTKKEEVTGKAWDSRLGFINKTFNYTSGLINTSNSFRQKYGLFEAKVRMNPTYPVSHAFWMIADKMVPHIDVVKYDKKIMMNNFWMNGHENVNKNITKLGASKYTSGYFIYSLEWKPGTLTWKINGETVTTQTIGVPDEAMYISFSSGIFGKHEPQQLPATMEIDWVRCYQFKD